MDEKSLFRDRDFMESSLFKIPLLFILGISQTCRKISHARLCEISRNYAHGILVKK